MSIIEKIKAEVERMKNDSIHLHTYDDLLRFLDTLQEQPVKDFPTTDEEMKAFLATHPKVEVPERYKKPDWVFEQPVCEGLEEAATKYAENTIVDFPDQVIFSMQGFIVGAKWQKEKDEKDLADMLTVEYLRGVEFGKQDTKEQMMKEAVEGFVATHLTSEGTKVTVNSGYLPKEMCIKSGDKVRIIVCKKED